MKKVYCVVALACSVILPSYSMNRDPQYGAQLNPRLVALVQSGTSNYSLEEILIIGLAQCAKDRVRDAVQPILNGDDYPDIRESDIVAAQKEMYRRGRAASEASKLSESAQKSQTPSTQLTQSMPVALSRGAFPPLPASALPLMGNSVHVAPLQASNPQTHQLNQKEVSKEKQGEWSLAALLPSSSSALGSFTQWMSDLIDESDAKEEAPEDQVPGAFESH